MRTRGHIECDSCGTPNDGWWEPGEWDSYAKAGMNPRNIREVQFFWLCRECKVEYPKGPKDFYVEDFFDTDAYCEVCEVEEVKAWGDICGYCEEG